MRDLMVGMTDVLSVMCFVNPDMYEVKCDCYNSGPLMAPRSQDVNNSLVRAPVEWREVSIVVAAGVVPIEAECVEMARCGMREREARVRRVHGVVYV
jgi:hypothetical protein